MKANKTTEYNTVGVTTNLAFDARQEWKAARKEESMNDDELLRVFYKERCKPANHSNPFNELSEPEKERLRSSLSFAGYRLDYLLPNIRH